MQWALALTNGIPVTYLAIGDETTDGVNGLVDLVNFLLSKPSPPTVVTLALGENENTLTETLAKSVHCAVPDCRAQCFHSTVCNAFAQLGTRGISMLVPSGDGGVAGILSQPSRLCATAFVPTFPSTCPL